VIPVSKAALVLAMAALLLGGAAVRAPATAADYPDVIPLPRGWQPEGIVAGRGFDIYSGSRANGGIYVADIRTGEGRVLVPPQAGRGAYGLSFDDRTGYLFVAGGPGGAGYVYNTATGAPVAAYRFITCVGGTFVNDVIVTRDAAYFTDSRCPVLFRVPLGPGGALPTDPGAVQALPIGGDYTHLPGFNLNGIEATPDGRQLIVVQSGPGLLFRVDAQTGSATRIDIGAATAVNGDGLLLRGSSLYVVRNLNQIVTEFVLDGSLSSGALAGETGSPLFRSPTTIAAVAGRLYVVNARFGAPGDPTQQDSEIVRVPGK
jgi:hypothetical protein